MEMETAISETRAIFDFARKELKKAHSPVNPSQLNMAIEDAIDNLNETEEVVFGILEKQIPKKPNITLRGTTGWNTEAYCPVCKTMVHSSYCSGCGQAIKWGD